jgi:TrmH family RNA methyltransferase
MPLRLVQSKHNQSLKELRRALSAPGRDALAAIEGPILLAEALRAGLTIRTVFAANDSEPILATLALPPETEILLTPRDLLNSALTTENPQPIAALVEPPRWSWHDLFQDKKNILVLAGIQDPGNLGTILRSAEAFGATGIICLPGTVSEWNPKAVRASAGSLFRLPLLHATWEESLARLHAAGIQILAATAHQAQPATKIDLTRPTALVIGNEGNGIPPEIEAQADAAITIPCPGPVESLNAAVAASILLYEAARQRASN